MRTADGRITEVVYLSGATPDSGMVEVHLQSAGPTQLTRLAPAGFLRHSGLLLREGDTVIVKGFPVAGMQGDLLVATELHKGDKDLVLTGHAWTTGLVAADVVLPIWRQAHSFRLVRERGGEPIS